MKPFELGYLVAEPLLPPLWGHVRRELLRRAPRGARILDVGGRKSHYTVGVRGSVTISDLPRTTALQEELHLGINDDIVAQLRRRRSNVETVVYDDMTKTALPAASFDVVVAVEVLEHVEEDDLFVQNVYRVLKPGGWFLMTTPNCDFVENRNPDHKRHYRRAELFGLLRRHFDAASVRYAIPGGRWRKMGLRPWSLRAPVQTLLSMTGNVVNRRQCQAPTVHERAAGTYHLIADARRID